MRIADRSESKAGLDYVQCGTSVRELAVKVVKPDPHLWQRLADVKAPIRKVGMP